MSDSFGFNEVLTLIITVANILMWLSMHRTIKVQTASNRSLNYQSLIQGHRNLLLGLMKQRDILNSFAKANDFDCDQWTLQVVSTFFINHAWGYYTNFQQGTLDQYHLESFRKDAQDMFSWPSVQKRWQQSKSFYPENFRRFVDTELCPTSAGA